MTDLASGLGHSAPCRPVTGVRRQHAGLREYGLPGGARAPFARSPRGRPITMQRFPDGIDESGFYEKKAPDHFPDWVARVRVDTENGSQEQITCENAATLAYLADQACVTPHVWLATRDDLEAPDQMGFDLDPQRVRPDGRAALRRAGTAGCPGRHPLDWSEDGSTAPQRSTIANINRRLGQRDDPWRGFGRHGQSLDDAARRLDEHG